MNIFQLHQSIMADYKAYIDSFINIKNEKIKAVVEKEVVQGKLWQPPLIQFNPSFELGDALNDLSSHHGIHSMLEKAVGGYTLHKHQADAIKLGAQPANFIVSSGTGSGKSLTFIGTIFNYLFGLAEKSKGVKAVIVYPMNALINSQEEELKKYKSAYETATGQIFPISFAKYTGQESEDERQTIRDEESDIILTNYMMLELLLTRSGKETILRESIYGNLRFLVYDELHTFRGRQGADVALLNRRIRAGCTHKLTCIGTSATLISGGTRDSQKKKIAEVATEFFGDCFEAKQIIFETLRPSVANTDEELNIEALIYALGVEIDLTVGAHALMTHPLLKWLDTKVALQCRSGLWERGQPQTVESIATRLSNETGFDPSYCKDYLLHFLEWLGSINLKLKADDKNTILPYKFHQFIAQTGSVYVTLDGGEEQIITLEAGHYKVVNEEKKPLYPVVFSRESGHEFLCVTKDNNGILQPREFSDWHSTEDEEDQRNNRGYLIVGENIWNPEDDLEYLPSAWLKKNTAGKITGIAKDYADRIPQLIYFNSSGEWSAEPDDAYPRSGWFMKYKLLFDPTSQTFYDPKTNDGTKLSRLGSEGRSTSTSVLTFSILRQMAKEGFPIDKQKVLSFTDNRQDAALQAGHFNDYIDTVRVRSAIYHAVANSPLQSLEFVTLGTSVLKALNVDQDEYAASKATFPGPKAENEKAFKTYLIYRALEDLKRSWRVVLPNLEQCALLDISYKWLFESCIDDNEWSDVPVMSVMDAAEREEFVIQILDYFRKSYAIRSEEYLTVEKVETNKELIRQKLKDPWRFEQDEKLFSSFYMAFTKPKREQNLFTASIGSNSAFGKYIRRIYKRHEGNDLKAKDYRDVVSKLLEKLDKAGWVDSKPYRDVKGDEATMYQLNVETILWQKSVTNLQRQDQIKNTSGKDNTKKGNQFFADVYKTDFSAIKRLRAEDHTGQLATDLRQQREDDFRSGELSALYCSPTMELGVDISSLDVVHMRNVPPNPANYAQRSGRAGRSGQAALVFTYCSNYSPHDRNYYNRAIEMVSGSVVPPTLDLYNEEMLRAHLHAVYAASLGLSELNNSIVDLIDENRLHEKEMPFHSAVVEKLAVKSAFIYKIKATFQQMLMQLDGAKLSSKNWYSNEWLDAALANFNKHLAKALERWCKLYLDASALLARATAEINSGLITANSKEFREAQAKQKQAQQQIDLLRNTTTRNRERSEFYPYRYLAAEGFLPGYGFTRLPIRTFVQNDVGEYISRPRAIALREFGPRNIIYHNGNKYAIDQLQMPDLENNLFKAKVSTKSGYLLSSRTGDYDNELCPFTGEALDNDSNREVFTDLLEMSESRAKRRDRISCEEEERSGQGYIIDTYFNIPAGLHTVQKSLVRTLDGEELFKMHFIPTANLININKGWRNVKARGFKIGKQYGYWKKENTEHNEEPREEIARVMLYTATNTDALYLQPLKALNLKADGLTTLMYALKRAIELRFQIEPRELGAVLMGDDDNPNIMLYESAEGSLGILSQLISPSELSALAVGAYKLCRFDDEGYKDPASYNDLLSYFNQRDHAIIDRALIKETLRGLEAANVTRITNTTFPDYDAHYQSMISQYDTTSVLEKKFLDHLYRKGLRLPDKAQNTVDGIYSRPDFYYTPDCHIFIDGSVHDTPQQKEHDRKVRELIRNRGEDVWVYHYLDNLEEKIAGRPDIFKKIR